MKAAICYEFGQPLVVEEVKLDPPQAGEVRVSAHRGRSHAPGFSHNITLNSGTRNQSSNQGSSRSD